MPAMRHLLACAAILLAAPLLGCGDNRKVNEGDVDAPKKDSDRRDGQVYQRGRSEPGETEVD